ncbi:unnamed protein product [Closterium sp. Naga37s-1]|nr:unnamed protein product [Closterium sp. Naga37s-1]
MAAAHEKCITFLFFPPRQQTASPESLGLLSSPTAPRAAYEASDHKPHLTTLTSSDIITRTSSPESLGVLSSPAARAALIASLTSASSASSSTSSSSSPSSFSSLFSTSLQSHPSASASKSPQFLSWSSLRKHASQLLSLDASTQQAQQQQQQTTEPSGTPPSKRPPPPPALQSASHGAALFAPSLPPPSLSSNKPPSHLQPKHPTPPPALQPVSLTLCCSPFSIPPSLPHSAATSLRAFPHHLQSSLSHIVLLSLLPPSCPPSSLTQQQQASEPSTIQAANPTTRTAVCLTGSARDFELTGPSIVARLLPSLHPYHPVLFLVAPLDEHSHKLWALQWGLGKGRDGGSGEFGGQGGSGEQGEGLAGGLGRNLKEGVDAESAWEGEVELGAVEMGGSVWVDGEEVVGDSKLYNNTTARSMQPQLQYLQLLSSCLSLIDNYQHHHPSSPPFHRLIHSRLDSYWSAPPSLSSAFPPSLPNTTANSLPAGAAGAAGAGAGDATAASEGAAERGESAVVAKGAKEETNSTKNTSVDAESQQQEQEEEEWVVPFGSDYSGINDAFGMGSLEAARKVLSRLSSIQELVKAGLSNLSPEATLKAHTESTGVHVARADWPLCIVSHQTYKHGRQGEVLVASLQSRANLNGAKGWPCTPKYTGLEALSHIAWAPASNRILSPSAHPLNMGTESIQLCDTSHPWELAWTDNYDAAAGSRLAGMRRAISSTNLKQCVQLMGQLQRQAANWSAPPAAAICVRSLLGKVSLVGCYGMSFPTALAVITPNSVVYSTSPRTPLPWTAGWWESHLPSLLPGLSVHALPSSPTAAPAHVIKVCAAADECFKTPRPLLPSLRSFLPPLSTIFFL